MKAIIQRVYGPPQRVMRLEEIEKPTPNDDQVLVRVKAASANAGDWRKATAKPMMARLLMGIRRPKVPTTGVDAAGVVEAVGSAVTDLKPGDEVFGFRTGAFGEYVAGKMFVAKPRNLSFEQAAAIPVAAGTALVALRDKGKIRPGQRVAITGAGGGVGTFAVQIAKAYGAHVTAITSSDKVETVKSIGADRVVDYTAEDFTRSDERYDLIVDVAGRPSVSAFRRVLAPDGKLILVGAGRGGTTGVFGRIIGSYLRTRLLHQPIINFIADLEHEHLLTLKQLAEDGKIVPVIDRTYPLERTAEAITYLQTEGTRGKLVITVA